MDWSIVRCFKYNKLGHMANECKIKLKDKAYLALKSKYEALLKQTARNKQTGSNKAYIAEGKCLDDYDEDEDDTEFYNYALM